MVRAGLTVDKIVQAAAEMADEVGIENVTVSALARRFGVRDASLYSHIRNLAELRRRVALQAGDEQAERIAEAVAGRAGRDALVAFADAYRDYAREHPGRYAAMQIPVEPDAARGSRGVEVTAAMMRAYALPDPDLTDAVRLLRSTFHGFISLEANGAFGHPRDVQASWEKALEALHRILTTWPTGDDGGRARRDGGERRGAGPGPEPEAASDEERE
ncbi:TetR family transcriptional regulator [Actinomadura logoneensis]|uniref:TetR family transcriptional regulator n=1 Tax=Actinomadura logoneensis TaxID=2293572 RepID=A0A372JM55_9ACTN|nr:TetR/AcrR family transcriptional regulator [Actinomadura logoneensis]RFU41101.1 TetR family transcriptional regulator [Actinomadura logoneensis]